MIGVIGIILSLVLLIYLAYKGWSVILIAPVLALIAASFTLFEGGEFHALAIYTEDFMKSLGNYVKTNFPMFMLGAVFGKMMDASGCANSIANFISTKLGPSKAIIAVVMSCAVITYGGVSLFVAAFAMYPIGAVLFREAGIPKRLLPGAIALGAFTFTMTAIPGTPQIQNAIPMPYFGTDAFAAPVLGIIAAIIEVTLGLWWLTSREKKARAAGEGYGEHLNEGLKVMDTTNLPNFGVAVAPIIVVIAANFVLSKFVFGQMDAPYLEAYGTTIGSVKGTWSLVCALVLGIIMVVALNYKRFDNVVESLKAGVGDSLLAIMNTASEVGYGNVIKALGSFSIIAAVMMGLSDNPLVGGTIAASGLAGITGSASGGMSIALDAFGAQLLEMAAQTGISPEALHRVVAVASGGFDTLPHNGAVITLLFATKMTHKQSYVHIGMCTVIIPTIASIVIILLHTLFGIC